MLTILGLFGRSPFAPLQSHVECVAKCVHCLPDLIDALKIGDEKLIAALCEKISAFEHEADIIKNDIRNHLPKGLFLPIPRESLLDILSIQDRIADKAEDAAVLVTLRHMEWLPALEKEFALYLQKNIETFDEAKLIVCELHELVESSFGGMEAEKVRAMVDRVASHEHETDIIQRALLKKLFQASDLSPVAFFQWQRLIEHISAISNLSENLGWRIRMTLDIK